MRGNALLILIKSEIHISFNVDVTFFVAIIIIIYIHVFDLLHKVFTAQLLFLKSSFVVISSILFLIVLIMNVICSDISCSVSFVPS